MKKLILSLLLLTGLTAVAQVDRSVQPTAGPAPEINIQEPRTFDLSNGLQVIVVEDHKLPRVVYSLQTDNPPVKEGDAIGVSDMLSSMLGKGSKSIDKDAFYEEVDYMGASINFGSSSAFANGLSKYSERIIQLMADAALHPNFSQKEFDKEKNIILENLKSNEKNVGQAASKLANVLAYGENNSKGEILTAEKLEKVTMQDMQQFYKKVFIPNNAYLVVIGDVKYKDVKKQVKKYFGDWKEGAALKNTNATPENVADTEIDFVDMPNAVQSEIIVLNLVDLKMKDADYFPVIIANQILGGGGEGRLFLNLREDKGYTYGAYSSIGNDKYGATTFRASASVRNEVTDSAVVAFLDEIKNFRDKPVSKEDLKNAKAKYTGSFVRSLEQQSTLATFALNIETENLDDDFYKDYLTKLEAVTIEDVQRVAKKYFMVDNARIIVAGKGSEVLDNLEKVNFNGKTIPVNYFDKQGNDVPRPEYKIEIPEGMNSFKVLANYLEAIGGVGNLENVNAVSMEASASIQGQSLELVMVNTTDNKFLQTLAMAGNVMSKQVLNGDNAFAVQQGQKIPVQGEQYDRLKAASVPFPELAQVENPEVKLVGAEKVDGKPAYVVDMANGETLYFDIETGLKLRKKAVINMGPQSIEQVTNFSNYQEVEGIKFPFTISQSFGPQNFDFNVSKIEINPELSASDFE